MDFDDALGSPVFEDDDELDSKLEGKIKDAFAGDLDLSTANDSVLLSRMPKITWKALSELNDDDEIRVGTIRMQGDRQNPAKVSLMLDSNLSAFRLVPREYNMRAMNNTSSNTSSNTFVFTEKNLPGYAGNTARQGTQVGRPQPTEKKEAGPGRRFRTPGYKRAIPKKTALIGHVKSEYNCLPVENQDYVNILTRRHAENPQESTAPQFLEGRSGMTGMLNPGGTAHSSFANFIKSAPQKEKKQQQKAARMPQNELLDLLFRCFQQFKYWHLKDLRLKTQQPESYLRETLEGIAEMVRHGNHANTWRLRESANVGDLDMASFATAESVAPAAEGSDDEDEDLKMEDAD